MPLYEYECTSCHRRIEKIQKFSDPDLTLCPHCGGALERTITAAAVSFKGGGWYKDGYASVKPTAPTGGGDSTAALNSASAAAGSAGAGSAGAGSAGAGSAGAGSAASGSGDSAKLVTAPSTSPAPAAAATTKA
jgi:putative FmdB family regulatory protein